MFLSFYLYFIQQSKLQLYPNHIFTATAMFYPQKFHCGGTILSEIESRPSLAIGTMYRVEWPVLSCEQRFNQAGIAIDRLDRSACLDQSIDEFQCLVDQPSIDQ